MSFIRIQQLALSVLCASAAACSSSNNNNGGSGDSGVTSDATASDAASDAAAGDAASDAAAATGGDAASDAAAATGGDAASDAAAATGGDAASDAAGDASSEAGTSQTPPMGGAAVEAWLAQGFYKSWNCESAVHASRSPSPHNFNRICSNDIISASVAGTATWPEGAAAVKELYDTATDTTPVGYAVYLKTQPDSATGAGWYWYERVPLTGLQSAAPHDATTGVVADGLGGSGTPLTICVGCHVAAGSDGPHTPSVGGRDFVYTPVQ